MRRKGVVFSKMFVLRSMGNELVPSPRYFVSNRATFEYSYSDVDSNELNSCVFVAVLICKHASL